MTCYNPTREYVNGTRSVFSPHLVKARVFLVIKGRKSYEKGEKKKKALLPLKVSRFSFQSFRSSSRTLVFPFNFLSMTPLFRG